MRLSKDHKASDPGSPHSSTAAWRSHLPTRRSSSTSIEQLTMPSSFYLSANKTSIACLETQTGSTSLSSSAVGSKSRRASTSTSARYISSMDEYSELANSSVEKLWGFGSSKDVVRVFRYVAVRYYKQISPKD